MSDSDLFPNGRQILHETSDSDRYAASAGVLSTVSENDNFHLEPTNNESASDYDILSLDNDVRFSDNEQTVTNCSETTSSTSLATITSTKKKKRRRLPRKRCEMQTCRARLRVRKLDCGHRLCVPCIRSLNKRKCPHCLTRIGNYLPPEMMGGENWENEMETEEPENSNERALLT